MFPPRAPIRIYGVTKLSGCVLRCDVRPQFGYAILNSCYPRTSFGGVYQEAAKINPHHSDAEDRADKDAELTKDSHLDYPCHMPLAGLAESIGAVWLLGATGLAIGEAALCGRF